MRPEPSTAILALVAGECEIERFELIGEKAS